jgi:hypothetical protein
LSCSGAARTRNGGVVFRELNPVFDESVLVGIPELLTRMYFVPKYFYKTFYTRPGGVV